MYWHVTVPDYIQERLRAGQRYEIDFRPQIELYVFQAVRSTGADSKMESLSGKDFIGGNGRLLESDQMSLQKDETGVWISDVTDGVMKLARIEVIDVEGDGIWWIDTTTTDWSLT